MAEATQEAIEKVLLTGDLSALNPDQRLAYYKSVCESLRLNPLTQPFGYIQFEGKLQLYARKDATEQLRKVHKVSITELVSSNNNGVYTVTVKASMGDRSDMATGAVAMTYSTEDGVVKSITGNALANVIMKAETKAKRRVTLSICGLGILDESELEDVEYHEQRPATEIIERNVRQATANALPVGPPPPAAESYGDVKVHIGKAEGPMIGRKVSELHDNILEWLKTKWAAKLNPLSATDQDLRLDKAVRMEWERRHATPTKPPESLPAPTAGGGASKDRQAILDRLRGLIDDLVLTPAQFCGYLRTAGYATAERLEELDDEQLHYLTQNWQATKDLIGAMTKPKGAESVSPPIPVAAERPQDTIINQTKPRRRKKTKK